MIAFFDIEPCSLVEVHRRFRGANYLHHQGNDFWPWCWRQYANLKLRSTSTRLHGAISKKALAFNYDRD